MGRGGSQGARVRFGVRVRVGVMGGGGEQGVRVRVRVRVRVGLRAEAETKVWC